ncbi:MAG: DUF2520 domain-containing protein [Candidatus Bathyarchaeota archaeon]|nr:DUF2520 domain-containing protein [Candidatus Bathyarchaeota archaeon]
MVKNKIVIIGAGKIAYSLTSALKHSGYDIQIIISKKLESAKSLTKKYSVPRHSNTLKNIPEEVNVFFLTIPDGEIKSVAEKLSKLRKNFNNCICIHFSGVENINSLKSLAEKSCATGSLHIIRPFPSKKIVDIKNSPASIETNNKLALEFLIRLCKKLKLKPHRITSEEKVFHHLAAVHSSNFLVGNLFNAFSLISSKNNAPNDILRKTTQSALDNVFKLSPAKALSGPIDRGDIYTIKKHINALNVGIKKTNKNHLKLLRKNYIVQSLSLLDAVKAKYGRLRKRHQEIKRFLLDELG